MMTTEEKQIVVGMLLGFLAACLIYNLDRWF